MITIKPDGPVTYKLEANGLSQMQIDLLLEGLDRLPTAKLGLFRKNDIETLQAALLGAMRAAGFRTE